MRNLPQSPERDWDTKVKNVFLYKRPLQNNLANYSSSIANYPNQALNSEQISNANVMHFLFIVFLENDREYILEFSNNGYNLEIFTQSKLNFSLEKKLKLKRDFTLKRLKDITFTKIEYHVINNNCIHFAENVMKKLDQKFTLFNPGDAFYILCFCLYTILS